MNQSLFTESQASLLFQDLTTAFQEAGFEMVEEPYIDYTLCGFRATFLRRYLLHHPTSFHDGILTTIIHVIGLPFGHNGQKMVILSAPRNLKNEPVCETIKLRIQFNEDGQPSVVHNESSLTGQAATMSHASKKNESGLCQFLTQFVKQSNQQLPKRNQQLHNQLSAYVSHIIESISPGLIQLPIEMKLEILKKLSIDSIIKMSQVNNEFKHLIFDYGESLWRHLCYRDFDIKFINRSIHATWMELYRDTYSRHQAELCRKERALPGLPERPALPPAPYMLQIEWLPQVLELPFYPERLALEFHPLHRVNSLDNL